MNCECENVKDKIDEGQDRWYALYFELAEVLDALAADGKFELLAGDCDVRDVQKVFESDEHYTIKHIYKCKKCGETVFIGACIRGSPICRYGDQLPGADELRSYWGRLGSLFDT